MNIDMQKMEIYANVVAGFVILSFSMYIGLAVLGVYGAQLDRVGPVWIGVYTFILIMSATKLYGTGVYNAVKAIGKGLLPTSGRRQNKK